MPPDMPNTVPDAVGIREYENLRARLALPARRVLPDPLIFMRPAPPPAELPPSPDGRDWPWFARLVFNLTAFEAAIEAESAANATAVSAAEIAATRDLLAAGWRWLDGDGTWEDFWIAGERLWHFDPDGEDFFSGHGVHLAEYRMPEMWDSAGHQRVIRVAHTVSPAQALASEIRVWQQFRRVMAMALPTDFVIDSADTLGGMRSSDANSRRAAVALHHQLLQEPFDFALRPIDPRAIEPLIERLRDTREQKLTRDYAARILAECSDERAADAVFDARDDIDWVVLARLRNAKVRELFRDEFDRLNRERPATDRDRASKEFRQTAMAELLVAAGDESMVPYVVGKMLEYANWEKLRHEAWRCLWFHARQPHVTRELIAYMRRYRRIGHPINFFYFHESNLADLADWLADRTAENRKIALTLARQLPCEFAAELVPALREAVAWDESNRAKMAAMLIEFGHDDAGWVAFENMLRVGDRMAISLLAENWRATFPRLFGGLPGRSEFAAHLMRAIDRTNAGIEGIEALSMFGPTARRFLPRIRQIEFPTNPDIERRRLRAIWRIEHAAANGESGGVGR